MKRVLLLAVSLATLLALAWLLIRRESAPASAVTAPVEPSSNATPRANESMQVSSLELPANNQPGAREELAADVEIRTDIGTRSASTVPTIVVRCEVLYAGSNSPVPGALVELGPTDTTAGTNAEGRAVLRVPLGTALTKLRVDPGDDAHPFVPYARDLDERPLRKSLDLRVLVERGCDLRGIVIDADTRRPVPLVRVRCNSFGLRTDFTTGDDGTFRLIALFAGPQNIPQALNFERREYLPARFQPEASDMLPDAKPVEVLLRRGIEIGGRIVDTERRPVARAEIVLMVTPSRSTYSDAQGQFTLDGLGALENARLVVGTQATENGAVLGAELELGPVIASRSDIELQVQSALELRVFAELPDGTHLTDKQFQVVGGSSQVHPGDAFRYSTEDSPSQTRIVQRGPDVEIEVLSTAVPEGEANVYLRGSARVQTTRAVTSPHEVHVVLAERRLLDIPPLPAGAKEIEIDGQALAGGAIDVQLLDDSTGRPIGRTELTTKHVFLNQRTSIQGESWIRLRAFPGSYVIQANVEGGPSAPFPITIPVSGYAKAEWRLRLKP